MYNVYVNELLSLQSGIPGQAGFPVSTVWQYNYWVTDVKGQIVKGCERTKGQKINLHTFSNYERSGYEPRQVAVQVWLFFLLCRNRVIQLMSNNHHWASCKPYTKILDFLHKMLLANFK